MNNTNIFDHNRVILCHFDSYSTASVFARYGTSVLAPASLPANPAEIAGKMPALQPRPNEWRNHHDP